MTQPNSLKPDPLCLTIAILAIVHAVALNGGNYDPIALRWLGVGIAMAWAALLVPCGVRWRVWAYPIIVAGLAWQLLQFQGLTPNSFKISGIALGIGAAGAILGGGLSRSVFIPLLLAIHFIVGAWMLEKSARPMIDVYEVTKDACLAISHGQNPYAIDFPDIYTKHPEWEKAFYAPGYIVNGRVKLGYPYMPLNLAIAYVGHVFGGDFRFGNLLVITAAGGFLAYAARNALAVMGGCLLLLTPSVYEVAYKGWSEPAPVFCLAAVVFCACRWRAMLPWAVGLLLVSKQYMFLAAPAVLLIAPRPMFWFWAKAILLGAVITLPLALWNFHAFYHSAVQVQFDNPFRLDSLNFAAFWARHGHAPPPQWIVFAAAIAAIGITMRFAPPTPAGFAASVAVIYLSFFMLAKQAFCNYYFFTIGALCCALAACQPREQSA